MIATLLLPLLVATQDPPKAELPPAQMTRGQLVFLVEPETKPKIEGDGAEQQLRHLEFLEGLWRSGKALLVGPFQNAGARKGLVLLDVQSPDEAKKLLADDPWVKAGQLTTECHTWFYAKNYVKKGEKFLDIHRLWFGTLERPAKAPEVSPEESAKIQEGHMANIKKMAESGALYIAGPFVEDTPLRGVFIFKNMERAEIEKLAAEDPAIKAGRLELKLVPWFTAKGSFLLEAESGPSAEDQFRKHIETMQECIETGDYKGAVAAIDQAIKVVPGSEPQLGLTKYEFLARMGDRAAVTYGKSLVEKVKDNPGALNNIAWFMVDDDVNFKDPDLAFAVETAKLAVALTKQTDPTLLDTLAYCQFKKGDIDAAIKTQEKAVALLDNQKDMDEPTKQELRDRLSKFRKAKKAKDG